MLKKINDLIFKNFLWKLVSLAIAAMLWFVGLNINNPIGIYSLDLIDLGFENYDRIAINNFVLLNEENLRDIKVEVRVRASRNDFYMLKDEIKYIKATIDMKPIDFLATDKVGQLLTPMVDIYIPSYIIASAPSVEIVTIEPRTVSVELDHYVTKDIPIKVIPQGEVAEGYVSMQPEVFPQYIQVSGAQTQLDQIALVQAGVELTNATENIIYETKPIAYNAEGEDITDTLAMLTNMVTISVPVSKYTGIKLTPRYKRSVALGYMISNIQTTPEYLELVGEQSVLEATSSIPLPPVDVTGANGSRSVTYNMHTELDGTGLEIKEGSPFEVEVEVTIVKESVKDMRMLIKDIRFKGWTSEIDIKPSEILFTVKGAENRIRSITEDDIVCTVDLSSVSEGVHEVMVDFQLPSGVVLVSDIPSVIVSIAPTEATPTEEGNIDGGTMDEEESDDSLSEDEITDGTDNSEPSVQEEP